MAVLVIRHLYPLVGWWRITISRCMAVDGSSPPFAPIRSRGADFPTELSITQRELFFFCVMSADVPTGGAQCSLALQLSHKRSQRELFIVFDINRCAK